MIQVSFEYNILILYSNLQPPNPPGLPCHVMKAASRRQTAWMFSIATVTLAVTQKSADDRHDAHNAFTVLSTSVFTCLPAAELIARVHCAFSVVQMRF